MPTECRQVVFLFAHQDDEFGVFQRLDDYRRQGTRIRCAYLTDGAAGGVNAATRNAESVRVLAQLGVAQNDIVFAGELLRIPDAALPHRLQPAADWIRAWFDSLGPVDALYVPAWEGGHHDHDALHALAVHIGAELGMLERMRQFALYNGARIPHPFFRTLSPLAENGPASATRIAWPMRLRCLRWCLSYPSQLNTWLGLFPFALWFYLTRGEQTLQPVSLERIEQRPHAGDLYYERRKFFTWPEMSARLSAWRAGALKTDELT